MEILASAFDAVLEVYFLTAFLKIKKTGYSITVIIAAVLLITLDYVFLSQQSGMEIICVVIAFSLRFCCTLILEGCIFKKLAACFISSLSNSYISVMLLSLTASVLGLNGVDKLHTAEYNAFIRYSILIAAKLLLFLSVKLILMAFKKVKYSPSPKEWGFVAVSFAVSNIVMKLVWWLNRSDQRGLSIVYIIVDTAIIFMNIMMIFLFQYSGRLNRKYKESELAQLKFKEDEKLFKQVEEQYIEARKIKHDMKGCINSALVLLKENKNAEAQEYLEKYLGEKVDGIVSVIRTDSSLINAVINSKLTLCDRMGIEHSCSMIQEIPPEMEFDLSFLISNLMDNAIEACEKLKGQKYISLSISVVKAYYHIVVKNTIEASVLESNPELKTTKTDSPAQHGYGLKSIKEIIDKYLGSIRFLERDNYFIVDAIINKELIYDDSYAEDQLKRAVRF